MASISAGDQGHGKKSVDQELPLVPFIDLLFCCVMFLLATAVWNQLGRVSVNQQTNGPAGEIDPRPSPIDRLELVLRITGQGFTLASSDGSSKDVGKAGDAYDLAALRTELAVWRTLDESRRDIVVEAEDGVAYSDVVGAIDVVVSQRFDQFSMAAPSTLQ